MRLAIPAHPLDAWAIVTMPTPFLSELAANNDAFAAHRGTESLVQTATVNSASKTWESEIPGTWLVSLLAVLDDEEPSINLSNSCGLYAHSLGLSHITSLFPPNFCCPRCCELYPRCRHDLRREYSGRWRAHPVPHTAVRTWLLAFGIPFHHFILVLLQSAVQSHLHQHDRRISL